MERTTAGAQSPRATVHALRSARGSPQRVIRDSTDFCDLWRKYHSLRAPIALRSICQFEIASVSWQRNGIFPPGAHGPQDIPGALFFRRQIFSAGAERRGPRLLRRPHLLVAPRVLQEDAD